MLSSQLNACFLPQSTDNIIQRACSCKWLTVRVKQICMSIVTVLETTEGEPLARATTEVGQVHTHIFCEWPLPSSTQQQLHGRSWATSELRSLQLSSQAHPNTSVIHAPSSVLGARALSAFFQERDLELYTYATSLAVQTTDTYNYTRNAAVGFCLQSYGRSSTDLEDEHSCTQRSLVCRITTVCVDKKGYPFAV